jgi:hypothetical protein
MNTLMIKRNLKNGYKKNNSDWNVGFGGND